ncbi:MAG: hypothetical protein FWC01_03705 [Treponema sp.]|nr:hypothetical protein [Treponema sp.]MCL2237508.1 hypothetical protein [Treponema sp.]
MAKITDKLDNINETLEKLVKVMDKPEHPIIKYLGIAGMIAGVFSIMSTIDIIMRWF